MDDSDDDDAAEDKPKPKKVALRTKTNTTSSNASSSFKSTSKPLEQLYLDPFETAGHSTISCAVCALSYSRTPDDMALHTKHHNKVVGGCDWISGDGKGVVVVEEDLDWGEKTGGRVLMTPAVAEGALGRRIKDLLSTIDRELSSTSLTDSQLAESKLFIFVTPQNKAIACAVVQRIKGAYRVTPSLGSSPKSEKDELIRFGEEEGAVFCSPTLLPTTLGIHRIWTSSSHRRSGLASIVLEAAARRFIYGCPIARNKRATEIAFSQPTGAGMALARRWTGTDAFRVFVE
ncbi:N-acetyltransferase [Pseudohyphozyma bogoriensis]|nr:N-acetyltransferase [Pseudohyphozyma bogoriensis]